MCSDSDSPNSDDFHLVVYCSSDFDCNCDSVTK